MTCLPVCTDRPLVDSRGGGTLSGQTRWDIVCSEEVGHCLVRGGGTLSVQRRLTLSVQRRWDIACSEEVGHCLFRGGGTLFEVPRNRFSLTIIYVAPLSRDCLCSAVPGAKTVL